MIVVEKFKSVQVNEKITLYLMYVKKIVLKISVSRRMFYVLNISKFFLIKRSLFEIVIYRVKIMKIVVKKRNSVYVIFRLFIEFV